MPFPPSISFEPVIFLREGLMYVVPFNGQQGTYSIFRKAPNSLLPLTVLLVSPGDTVTYKLTSAGASFFIRTPSGGFTQFLDDEAENGTEYLLYAYQIPYDFSASRTPDGLAGVKFWGKVSGSYPYGFNPSNSRRASIANAQPSLTNGITTLVNRIGSGAPNFQRPNDTLVNPSLIQLTASSGVPKLPVTSSRLTIVTSGAPSNTTLQGGSDPYKYVGEFGYHIFAVFQVTSMSNGTNNSFANNYKLLSDESGQIGAAFTTSSLSDFSPDGQYVNVTWKHNALEQTLTASMNALHLLEASFEYNTSTNNGIVRFGIDETYVSSSTASTLAGLGSLSLGSDVLPIGTGSTTYKTTRVTSSVDLAEVVFATTKSYDTVRDSVKNYFKTVYDFGIPISFKIPTLLANTTLWARTSPGDFIISGPEVKGLTNKFDNGTAFQEGSNAETSPIHVLVDAVKPLTGVNFSGSGPVPSLETLNVADTYVGTKDFQIFAALRTNSILTNFTGSSITQNEQIFGSTDQTFGLFLRSGSNAEILGVYDGGQQGIYVVSSSITLGQIYFVDFSLSTNVFRLKVNSQTEVTASSVPKLSFPVGEKFWLGMSTVKSVQTARKVNTDVFEFVLGTQEITDPERSLVRQYFLDRYSITGS